ncbi:MAG: hypothetical protein ACERKJ_00595 [Candidatus Dadabacteria bacterium]
MAELVAKSLILSDSYAGLRALLVRSKYKTENGRRKRLNFNLEGAGRWSLIRKRKRRKKIIIRKDEKNSRDFSDKIWCGF